MYHFPQHRDNIINYTTLSLHLIHLPVSLIRVGSLLRVAVTEEVGLV